MVSTALWMFSDVADGAVNQLGVRASEAECMLCVSHILYIDSKGIIVFETRCAYCSQVVELFLRYFFVMD